MADFLLTENTPLTPYEGDSGGLVYTVSGSTAIVVGVHGTISQVQTVLPGDRKIAFQDLGWLKRVPSSLLGFGNSAKVFGFIHKTIL